MSSNRQTDVVLSTAAITGIVIITCYCIHHGIDHTIVKIALTAIAGLAGFTLRGMITKT